MIVSEWEPDPILNEQVEAHRDSLRPACKNERHNLFWEIDYVGPMDSRDTIADYGLFQLRTCLRCQRVHRRTLRPETAADTAELVRMLDDFKRSQE